MIPANRQTPARTHAHLSSSARTTHRSVLQWIPATHAFLIPAKTKGQGTISEPRSVKELPGRVSTSTT